MNYPTTSSGVTGGGKGKDNAGLETSEQEMSAGLGIMEATNVLLGSVSVVPRGEMAEKGFTQLFGEFDLGENS